MEQPPYETAIQELHAVTYAVILHAECQTLREGYDSYWTRVLMALLVDKKKRSQGHAAAMAGSIPALMLRRACTDIHLDKNRQL